MATRRWSRAATWSVLILVLLASCSSGDSNGGGAGAAPAPKANAGTDETVAVGVPVTLDGSASESPTGIPVSYQWTLSEKPAGSTVSLTNPDSARPTFTPDIAGSYIATLVVQTNGVTSTPDSVSITCVTGNAPPRANAGLDTSAAPGRPITLDGTASRDPNNTTVTYSWRIVEQPPGSHPTLTNATSAKPTFTADIAGRYVIALICSDGTLTSTVDQIVIIVATGNLPPVANAGPDQTVTAGQVVTLDGRGSSDPNGDPLTYSWCLRGRPEGSTVTLNGANTARPTFTPDVAGSYVLCLTVNDGQASSAADSVVLEARVAPFNQGSGFNAVVNSIVLAQDGSRDLYVAGEFTSYKGTVVNKLIRLHADGTVAKTFGQVNGFPHLTNAKTGAAGVYVQGLTQFDGQPVPALIRLNQTGSLDPGFRLAAGFDPSSGPFFGPFGIWVAEDGSGDLFSTFTKQNPNSTSPGDTELLNIVRLNADGSVDSAFSTGNGFPTGSSMGDPQIISDLLPTSTGMLYVGGGMYSFNGVPVSSLIRLNPDGTLDSTFIANVGGPPSSGIPNVLNIEPAADGSSDLYAARWVGPLIRVHDTGAFDTSYKAEVSARLGVIAVVQDGSGEVLLASSEPYSLFRLTRNGELVSAPSFIAPTLETTDSPLVPIVSTVVPVQDGTGDFYIGGYFTSYNGVPVNHFARIHPDGSLASVVSGP